MFASAAAICTTLIGVPVGYVVTRYRTGIATLLDIVATLPFAIAGTVLAIGFVVSFYAGLVVLTGGPLILVLAYTVRKIPFAVRSASAIVHQIDLSLEEASISLGRSPLQTFLRIVVPLMVGGIVSGVVLTWVTVASELSATVVLYSGSWRTMTVVMFQALQGGGGGIATAAASTLIVVTLIPVALLYRLVRRYELGS
jgi:iron(III) transport system permease protein